jgi:hypothetical protein
MIATLKRREFISLLGGAVAARPLTVQPRRADQGRDCGAAEIQRTAENASLT